MYKQKQLHHIAEICFPPHEGQTFVNHTGKINHYIPAPLFLLEHGANQNNIEQFFTNNGQWKYIFEGTDLYQMSIAKLEEYLEKVFTPIYELVNISLNGISIYGYNQHGKTHIKRVVSTSRFLLEKGGYVQEEACLATIAGWAHDLGNLFSREAHPFVSIFMLGTIFPKLKEEKVLWQRIADTIRLHESSAVLEEMDVQSWSVTDMQALLEKATYLKPELLAVFIADKIDIGRH